MALSITIVLSSCTLRNRVTLRPTKMLASEAMLHLTRASRRSIMRSLELLVLLEKKTSRWRSQKKWVKVIMIRWISLQMQLSSINHLTSRVRANNTVQLEEIARLWTVTLNRVLRLNALIQCLLWKRCLPLRAGLLYHRINTPQWLVENRGISRYSKS